MNKDAWIEALRRKQEVVKVWIAVRMSNSNVQEGQILGVFSTLSAARERCDVDERFNTRATLRWAGLNRAHGKRHDYNCLERTVSKEGEE